MVKSMDGFFKIVNTLRDFLSTHIGSVCILVLFLKRSSASHAWPKWANQNKDCVVALYHTLKDVFIFLFFMLSTTVLSDLQFVIFSLH